MKPAFPSTRHAFGFGLPLLFFLLLPLILHSIGGVPLEQSYRGISERAGDFDYIREAIFDQHTPVDILFCGTSLLFEGIDQNIVRDGLSRALGRRAEVVLLGEAWEGWDMHYFVARDMIEHRKVRMLVMVAPAFLHRATHPHAQLFRVVRYGDHPGALDGLSFRSRAAIYGHYVLGAPRQMLNLLRPNLSAPGPVPDKHRGTRKGYAGAPFIERNPVPATLDPQSIYAFDRGNPSFHFLSQDLNDYQLHFLNKTVELARSHGVLLVFLHIPFPSERGMDFVPWQRRAASLLAPDVALAGIPSASMFRGIPQDQFLDFYQDEHMNANGRRLFTSELTPALVELYARLQ
jgi:hypothetical protein